MERRNSLGPLLVQEVIADGNDRLSFDTSIAGTSAHLWCARKNYPIYSALHRMSEGIKVEALWA